MIGVPQRLGSKEISRIILEIEDVSKRKFISILCDLCRAALVMSMIQTDTVQCYVGQHWPGVKVLHLAEPSAACSLQYHVRNLVDSCSSSSGLNRSNLGGFTIGYRAICGGFVLVRIHRRTPPMCARCGLASAAAVSTSSSDAPVGGARMGHVPWKMHPWAR